MNITTIQCPQCGFNSYKALNVKTNKEVTITISKCESGGCSIQIPEDDIWEEYGHFDDILLYSENRYKILEMIETDCFND
jgi:hypothetical protein